MRLVGGLGMGEPVIASALDDLRGRLLSAGAPEDVVDALVLVARDWKNDRLLAEYEKWKPLATEEEIRCLGVATFVLSPEEWTRESHAEAVRIGRELAERYGWDG